MAFSRQEYWSGLPCPPAGALPSPGIEPTSLTSPALAGKLFTPSAIWEAQANCSNPQTWESGADCVFKLSFKSGQIKMNEFQSVPVAFSF